jgi:hypothetical protein
MLRKLICLAAFTASSLIAVAQPASDVVPSAIVTEKNVAMKTRDGVTLQADIYRPAGDGPFYVLLVRTPYNKDGFAYFGQKAVSHGFMVVAQDVRGRYSSEGEWYPFKHETDDGYDAVEWAAALPHSNGKVGMFSGSYVGATQMLAAIGHPPHLAGICPIVTASNYHENWSYQGGAFEQWFNESWTSGLAQDTAVRQHDTRKLADAANALIGDSVLPLRNYPLFNLGDAKQGANLTAQLAPYFLDWLAHPTYDDYWRKWSIEENFQNIQVPALTIAAWYDIFLEGSLRNYMGLRDHAGNPAARANQRLVVAIGGHSGWGRKIGEVDFGPDAPFDENEMVLEWFDYLFLGKQNQFADAAHPVKVFTMGANEWRGLSAWPPPEAKPTRYLLSATTAANSATGGGRLSNTASLGLYSDSLVYDPANPVPTVGGPLCCDARHLPPGPRDQKEVEARPDVLVYSTLPLGEDLNVTGPVTLELYASSTAVDTDFTAKLVDVSPDGFARNVTEGILRASYRDSNTTPKPLVPGKIYKLTIDMVATSNVFLKGHKIRLEISSSNFPRFDRNLNTGKSAAESADFVKATNTIYHDDYPAHPSALILPIMP